MATHNKARVIGYLVDDPKILKTDDGFRKIVMQIMTTRRSLRGNEDNVFEPVLIYCDGDEKQEMIKRLESLKKMDLVDITGVLNILSINKPHRCPSCGHVDIRYQGTATFIYPLSVIKINNLEGAIAPGEVLAAHYKEISHEILIMGTVVSDPEMGISKSDGTKYCKYKLGVDRKYYIKTQSDIYADYPWVYSYGNQADRDALYLQNGSVIILTGYIHVRKAKVPATCSLCQTKYKYNDSVTDLIPYSVEYLSNFLTDADIAAKEKLEKMKR